MFMFPKARRISHVQMNFSVLFLIRSLITFCHHLTCRHNFRSCVEKLIASSRNSQIPMKFVIKVIKLIVVEKCRGGGGWHSRDSTRGYRRNRSAQDRYLQTLVFHLQAVRPGVLFSLVNLKSALLISIVESGTFKRAQD